MDLDFSNIDLDSLPHELKIEIIELLEERDRYLKYNVLERFNPYEFQKKFYAASDKYNYRFLCAANRVGKSFSEAAEVSWHLTGLYPEWWEGRKFSKPILLWCVGITGDSTRKVLQKELFGTSMGKDKNAIGTGAIPRSMIDFDNLEKDGNIIKIAKVKHHTDGVHDGWSTIEFRSTQQGEAVLMGATVDFIWMD